MREESPKRELKVGSRLDLTLTNNDTGEVVLKEEHEVVKAQKKKMTRTAVDESQFETRLVSQQWLDPELKALNEEREPEAPTTRVGGAADTAKVVVDAAKLGLDVAKFTWDVIKGNKAVVDTTATTTSVLYKDTDGLNYKGAETARTSSYTLSVRDSLFKDWECIHADIKCEGTYHATPSIEGIPQGYYLPDVHVYASEAHADWPCQLNAKAQLSNISNMGRANVDPMVTILSSIDFGWLFQRKHITVKFQASGSKGIHRSA